MTFLILEIDTVAALDLSDIICLHSPGAQVVTARKQADWRSRIADLPHITAAFVPARPADGSLSEAIRAARGKGAMIVQIGGAMLQLCAAQGDVIAVPSVFTTEDIVAAIRVIQDRAQQDAPRRQA